MRDRGSDHDDSPLPLGSQLAVSAVSGAVVGGVGGWLLPGANAWEWAFSTALIGVGVATGDRWSRRWRAKG